MRAREDLPPSLVEKTCSIIPFTGSSFSAASVFDPATLLRGRDPVGSKDTADLFTA
jgi:hypothetical protein